MIFNDQNIWMNLQNKNPTKILYELNDPQQWYPYFIENNQAQLKSLGSFVKTCRLESTTSKIDIEKIEF